MPCCQVFTEYDDDGNLLCRKDYYVMSAVRMDEAVQSFDMYAVEGRTAGLHQCQHPECEQQVRGAAEDPPVPRREVGAGLAGLEAGAVDFAAALERPERAGVSSLRI